MWFIRLLSFNLYIYIFNIGEDPLLASKLVEQLVWGLQSNNISGCLKHYALNEQETNRMSMNSNVDRRTAMEMYYPSFEAAIDAGIGSIMCSYNRINGTYACESYQMLEVDLRQKLGFKGWVRSDGWATHSTAPSANAGMEQEMPQVVYFDQRLMDAVKSGEVSETRFRQMAERQITALIALNMMDNSPPDIQYKAIATSPERVQFAREVVEKSTVLLKNEDQFLPLNANNIKTIAVFGDEKTFAPGKN